MNQLFQVWSPHPGRILLAILYICSIQGKLTASSSIQKENLSIVSQNDFCKKNMLCNNTLLTHSIQYINNESEIDAEQAAREAKRSAHQAERDAAAAREAAEEAADESYYDDDYYDDRPVLGFGLTGGWGRHRHHRGYYHKGGHHGGRHGGGGHHR